MKKLLILAVLLASSLSYAKGEAVSGLVQNGMVGANVAAKKNPALEKFYANVLIDPTKPSVSADYVNICCTPARKAAGAPCCATSSTW